MPAVYLMEYMKWMRTFVILLIFQFHSSCFHSFLWYKQLPPFFVLALVLWWLWGGRDPLASWILEEKIYSIFLQSLTIRLGTFFTQLWSFLLCLTTFPTWLLEHGCSKHHCLNRCNKPFRATRVFRSVKGSVGISLGRQQVRSKLTLNYSSYNAF